MKKFIFLTSDELNKTVEEMYSAKGMSIQARASFCEETETDIVILTIEGEEIEVQMADIQDQLSRYLNVEISHYDEMEVGDFGLGFLFFI